MAAESVNRIQRERVISTLKHFILNCSETNRHWLNAIIDPDAHRESDLVAFQIAIERSQPGAIMSSYNKSTARTLAAIAFCSRMCSRMCSKTPGGIQAG
jgi:beta-glucosidase